jgi:hypothetical protein
MEVKKDMTNATTGGIHMETSMPAVGKYKKTSDSVAAVSENKIVSDRHYGFVLKKLSSPFESQETN